MDRSSGNFLAVAGMPFFFRLLPIVRETGKFAYPTKTRAKSTADFFDGVDGDIERSAIGDCIDKTTG